MKLVKKSKSIDLYFFQLKNVAKAHGTSYGDGGFLIYS